ncbi:hypothetical protein BC567DRAFT_213001 [Phyllosticta citribraziliensis]
MSAMSKCSVPEKARGSSMTVQSPAPSQSCTCHLIAGDSRRRQRQAEPKPRADDFDAMKKQMMPELPDLETEAEAADTWEIKDTYMGMARRIRMSADFSIQLCATTEPMLLSRQGKISGCEAGRIAMSMGVVLPV